MFEISDWNPNTGLKWRVETSGDAARATGTLPFRAITICITIVVGRVKSADWADHACQYQYWWILMAVCGCRKNCSNHVVAHFRPVVTKIICICSIESWVVNSLRYWQSNCCSNDAALTLIVCCWHIWSQTFVLWISLDTFYSWRTSIELPQS